MADDTPTNSSGASTSVTSQPKFWVLMVVSLVVPLIGVIAGLIFLSKSDPADKRLGKTVLIVAGTIFVLYGIYYATK